MRALRRASIIGAGQQLGMVYDRFNRADGDIGNADSGQTWTVSYASDEWAIVSGALKRLVATVAIVGYAGVSITLPESIGDYSVEADITTPVAGEVAGIFGRGFTDIPYSVAVVEYYNSFALVTMTNGRKIDTTIASYAHSFPAGEKHRVRLMLSGTTAKIYLDRTEIISGTVPTWGGASYLGVGAMLSYSTTTPTVLFDNFRVF